MKLRVKFKKYGPVKYIGHLDVMRFFQKAIRRANIDICYTTGFSPHQVMSFAQPLGVGLESNGEYMDIQVNSINSTKAVMDSINAVSVYGIEITSVKILPDNSKNAMASVEACEYSVFFKADRGPDFDFEIAIKNILAAPDFVIQKKTKTGLHEIDIKPGIYEIRWDKDKECLHLLVDAASGSNIKPRQIIEKIFNDNNQLLHENALFIIREDTYTSITKEDGSKVFISLDEVGFLDNEQNN